MGLNITMLVKDAIITSKVIFLPWNFNHEKQIENRESISLLMPEIKLFEFLAELKILEGGAHGSLYKASRVLAFRPWPAVTILP